MPIPALSSLQETDFSIPGTEPWHARPEDIALSVMTDFQERSSVTVAEASSIDEALEHMKHVGVRCAFATSTNRRVVGLITAYDILGDAPTRHMQSIGGKRGDIMVRDIMRRPSDWSVLYMADLEQTTVGALNQIFDSTRLSHIPVMEYSGAGARQLRGLLSGAKVRRLLSR